MTLLSDKLPDLEFHFPSSKYKDFSVEELKTMQKDLRAQIMSLLHQESEVDHALYVRSLK